MAVRRWIARHPDATAYLAIVRPRRHLAPGPHLRSRLSRAYATTGRFRRWTGRTRRSRLTTCRPWRSNLFGYSETERTMSIYRLYIWGLLAELVGVDGWMHSRFPIAMIGLAGVLAYQAAKAFSLVRPAAFAAAVVYMTTPLFLDVFVTGYMPMFIGIAPAPQGAASRARGVRATARHSRFRPRVCLDWIGRQHHPSVRDDARRCRRLRYFSGLHCTRLAAATRAAPRVRCRDGNRRGIAASADRLYRLATADNPGGGRNLGSMDPGSRRAMDQGGGPNAGRIPDPHRAPLQLQRINLNPRWIGAGPARDRPRTVSGNRPRCTDRHAR